MNPQIVRLVPLTLLLLATVAIALGFCKGKEPPSKLIGHPIAQFTLPALDSPAARFSPKNWGGQIVVLHVFSTRSKTSAAEMPALAKLAQSGKVTLYGLAWRENPKDIKTFLTTLGNPYQQVGLDEHGQTTVALAISSIPQTYVINRDGTIVYQYKEPLDNAAVDSLILPIVDQLLGSTPK